MTNRLKRLLAGMLCFVMLAASAAGAEEQLLTALQFEDAIETAESIETVPSPAATAVPEISELPIQQPEEMPPEAAPTPETGDSAADEAEAEKLTEESEMPVPSEEPADEENGMEMVMMQLLSAEPSREEPSISFSSAGLKLGRGDTFDLKQLLVITPEDGETQLSFSSSNKKYASVTKDGIVKGVKKGSANITVKTEDGLSAKIKVTVGYLPSAKRISFSPKSLDMGVNTTETIAVKFSSGYYGLYTLESNDENVITVDPDGRVRAHGTGEAKITLRLVQDPSVKKTAKVTVKAAPEAIEASRSSLMLAVGQSSKKVFGVNPDPENTACGFIYESSDEGVVSVDAATGELTANGMGHAVIRITADNNADAAAECAVTVIELAQNKLTLGVGDQADIRSLLSHPDGNDAGEYSFTSGKKSYVTVNAQGIAKGVKRGSTDITIKSPEGLSVKVKVMVCRYVLAKYISISPSDLRLGVGMAGKLNVKFKSGYYGLYEWASENEDVVRVSADGSVYANAPGEAAVTLNLVKNPAVSKRAKVTVLPAPETIQASVDEITLGIGETSSALQGVNPDADNTMCAYIYESSDEGIVHVNAETGEITAVSEGDAEVTITASNNPAAQAVCRVHAVPAPQEISFDGMRKTMGKKEKYQLECTLYPEGASGKLKYKSSSNSVLEISSGGMMTAKRSGSATITVTAYNGVKGKFTVKVVSAPSSVKISAEKKILGVGECLQMNTTLGKGTAGACSFASSDANVIAVDAASGLATAMGEGNTTVTAKTYNGKKASIKLNVLPAPTEIVLSRTDAVLAAGDQLQLQAALNEGSAGAYRFFSTNEGVAAVDPVSGIVTAVSPGETQIIAEAYNGISASMQLRVEPELQAIRMLNLQETEAGYALQMQRGETYALEADMGCLTDLSLHFAGKNGIVQVSDGGELTAVRSGWDEITVTAYNGAEARIQVQVNSLVQAHRDIQVIQHAMGEVDGHVYSNSREAFLQNYAQGNRLFEVDFAYTSDGEIVLWHSWKSNQINSTTPKGYVPTLAEFEEMLAFDAYDTLTYRDLLQLMDQYPDVYFFLDTKQTKTAEARKQYAKMISIAQEMNLSHVLDRMVVMVYSKEMFTAVSGMYPFSQYAFMCYKYFDEKPSRSEVEAVMKYCSKNGIDILSMWDYWWQEAYAAMADQYGLDVNLHTVNSHEDAQKYLQQGAALITSDHLDGRIVAE